MHAAFLHGPYDVRLGELAEPVPGPGEVLVDIEAVGLCGSDLHYYKDGGIGGSQVIAEPFVPGHELAGRARQAIPERGIAEGARVAIEPARSCGRCPLCHSGRHNLCPYTIMTGAPPRNGGLTRTVPLAPSQLLPVPESFDPATTALLEPLGVCIHAVDLARPQWFERVVVLGAGPIGLGVLQLLHLAGIDDLAVIEPTRYRREHAVALSGARGFADVGTYLDATNGLGADLVLEATNSPMGFAGATAAATIGGRAVIIGIPDGNRYEFEASTPRRKQLQLIFSRRMGDVLPRAIRLVDEGRFDLQSWISHRIGLDQVPDAFTKLDEHVDGALKIVVDPR